jgi:hypothetical protein
MNSLITLIVTMGLLFTPSSALAVEQSTPSAETIQKSLQDRIKRAVKENLNGEKPTIQRLKAFFGSVVTISGDTITIQRHQNGALMTYQVTVNKDTKIVKTKSSDLKIENISLNDNVIAMGMTGDDQTMTAKRIVIKGEPSTIQKSALEANVLEIDTKKRSITYSQNESSITDTLSRRAVLYSSTLNILKATPDLPALAILVRLSDSSDDTNVITKVLFPYMSTSTSSASPLQ